MYRRELVTNDDMALARKILLDIAKNHAQVLQEPSAEVIVAQLSDSYVELQLRVWLAAADHGALKAYLLEQCWVLLGEQGFKTAYPQRHMHIHHHGKPADLSDGILD